ncbi:MAG: hypothetical protein R3E89_14875 [Thiolinea sp.]
MGPNAHVVAICQAAVPALAAVAVMAQEQDDCRPATMTLMAGPIDIRTNPQPTIEKYGKLIPQKAYKYALRTVPAGYEGKGRKVYPGDVQLGMFIGMNLKDHIKKHMEFFWDIVQGDEEKAEKHRQFYDEYMATMDGSGDFYLDTLKKVFFDFDLPQGRLTYQGKVVDCSAITDTALFTVEGENDDLCLIGNTYAAHDICDQLPAERKVHHLQPGVGHYGVFNGSRYRKEIAPRIKDFMQQYGATAADSGVH